MTTKQMTQAIGLAALILVTQVAGVAAQTIRTVTSNADNGPGSLRAVVAEALPGDTIRFDMAQVVSPIALSGGSISLSRAVAIEGPGPLSLTVRNTAAPSTESRVFSVGPGVTATISGLTISGGNVFSPPNGGYGGGILNAGNLTLSSAIIAGNIAGFAGGGIASLGGTLTLYNSTVSGNAATFGDGIYTQSATSVTHSTVAGNDGDGILADTGSSVAVVNSTISGHSHYGINAPSGVTIVNSTVSDNRIGIFFLAPLTVRNSIIGANGLDLLCNQGNYIVNAENSIIQSTQQLTSSPCLNGTNLNNLTSDPLLGPLQDNGGPTWTHALLPGSPAIDAGSNAAAHSAGLTTDQRGTVRFGGAAVDIGAVEFGQCFPGSYNEGTSCVPASPGFYVADAGATVQTPCAPGTYQPNAGATGCVRADPGNFANDFSAIQQTQCFPGTFQPNAGAAACLATDPGYFVSEAGAITQRACPVGRYQPGVASTGCVPASPGYFVATIAAVVPSPCAAGTYQPNAAAASCIPASPGRYVPGAAATDQLTCPVGTTSAAGASSCFPVAPVFPAGGVLDTFNRANGAVGARWSIATSTLSYRIAGNRMDVMLGGPILWQPIAFGPSQEAFVTLAAVDTNSLSQGVLLKVQTGGVPNAGAISVLYDALAQRVRVSTLRTSMPVWQPYPAIAATLVNGDQLGARALANGTVEVYKNGTRLATVTLSSSDQAFFNGKGGRIGLWTLAAANAFFDDFGGGSVP